ncbi:LptA/OstA family protein [Candidatus Hydrogenedentota bacterium]
MKPRFVMMAMGALSLIFAFQARSVCAQQFSLFSGSDSLKNIQLKNAESMDLATGDEDATQVLRGNVHVVFAAKDGTETHLKADKITLTRDDLGELNSMVAEGKVDIEQKSEKNIIKANGEKLVYSKDKQEMVMTGSPKISTRDGEWIAADKLRFDLEKERFQPQGNVHGILWVPKEEDTQPAGGGNQ